MEELVTQPDESVIRKIQKLLSLATGGNNSEEESTTAMAMAQKMLARYNLDYHTVQAAQVAGGTNAPEEPRAKTLVEKRSAQYKWQRELWKSIAEANFCWHWVANKQVTSNFNKNLQIIGKRHMLLGRESNLIAVRMMGDYLCDTIERLVPYPRNERLSRSAISWRSGCADRIIERIREQAESSRKIKGSKGSVKTSALSLRDVAQLEHEGNYDARHGKGLTRLRKKTTRSGRPVHRIGQKRRRNAVSRKRKSG